MKRIRRIRSVRSMQRKKTRKRKTYRKMRGGNYEKDITTRTFEGAPTKPLNKIVVTAPGLVLSGSAYMNLMESRDRNGTAY
jgi:hypothetical protein